MEGKTHPNEHRNEGFMPESDIESYFSNKFRNMPIEDSKKAEYFEKWYKAGNEHPYTYKHHDKIGIGKYFDCDTITDEWYKWFLTTPAPLSWFANPGNEYENGNAFLFNKKDTFVYFIVAAPFRKPDFRRVTITRKAPLLVPVYNMYASVQDYPSLKTDGELTDLITRDLAGVKRETFMAKLDGEVLHGCCVIRNMRLEIENIPTNNIKEIPEDRLLQKGKGSTIDLCHGGFWLLIKEDQFRAGDHLLHFIADSANYEIEAKILVSALI